MLISEIIELMKEDVQKAIALIEVKDEISFMEKFLFIKQVKNNAIAEKDGITYYDGLLDEFLFDKAFISAFTNLEFTHDYILQVKQLETDRTLIVEQEALDLDSIGVFISADEVDELKKNGIFDYIVLKLDKEYASLKTHYTNEINNELSKMNDTQHLLNRQILRVADEVIKNLNQVSSTMNEKNIDKIFKTIESFAKTVKLK